MAIAVVGPPHGFASTLPLSGGDSALEAAEDEEAGKERRRTVPSQRGSFYPRAEGRRGRGGAGGRTFVLLLNEILVRDSICLANNTRHDQCFIYP